LLLFYLNYKVWAHPETQPALVAFFLIYHASKVFTSRIEFRRHFNILDRAGIHAKLTALAPLDMKFYMRHTIKNRHRLV
jgi:hypothetical protein